jgi:Predicted phosphatases
MRAYKLIVFDFDGTLADSAPWFIGTLNDIAKAHGFRSVNEHEIAMLRGKPNREIIRYLGIRFWQMPAIARELRKRSLEAAGMIRLFDGVPGLLQQIKSSGAQLAIVSSNGEEAVRRVLGTSAAMIDHYACGVSLLGKAARFRQLQRMLKLQPRQVLAVGDEGRDVEAAHRAGFASAAVTWGYATKDALQRCSPTFIVNSLSELASLFQEGS